MSWASQFTAKRIDNPSNSTGDHKEQFVEPNDRQVKEQEEDSVSTAEEPQMELDPDSNETNSNSDEDEDNECTESIEDGEEEERDDDGEESPGEHEPTNTEYTDSKPPQSVEATTMIPLEFSAQKPANTAGILTNAVTTLTVGCGNNKDVLAAINNLTMQVMLLQRRLEELVSFVQTNPPVKM